MTLAEAVAVRLKKILKNKGYTQYYLYKQGGVPRSTVNNVIRASKGAARLETLYQISSTLGITLQEFFDDPIFEKVDD